MKKVIIYRVIFDRKKTSAIDRKGTIEVEVYIDRYHRKYVTTGVRCYPYEWEDGMVKYNENADVMNARIIAKVKEVKNKMARARSLAGGRCSPAMLFECLVAKSETERGLDSNLIDWMLLTLDERNDIKDVTKNRHRSVIDAILRYGKIRKFRDLTPQNIRRFDEFLRHETTKDKNSKEHAIKRETTTLRNYHKTLNAYCKRAKFDYIIEDNPYDHIKIERGKSKERKPLTEDEVLLLRRWKPSSRQLEKARDLFIFSCYTGLAYADAQAFVYADHTTIIDGKCYIYGERVKTGERFLTPILAPAMEILEKWNYNLPVLSNQKMNYSLHEIETILGFHKPLTSHVARHTFATLTLSKNVPIAVVQRLLGHADIATTQIYAKILDKTVADAVSGLDAILK